MRSGTSYFDWTVFKKTVTRFWPLWAIYAAIWLVTMPLQGLMILQTGSWEQLVRFSHRTLPGMADAALPLAVVFGAAAAMTVFSHLFNARSANFFGALPVRREGLFLTHYLAGLSFLIVPNLVAAGLALLVEAAGGAVLWQGLGYWLGMSCGMCFLFYSMAVFCGMFTGHLVALPVFYGVFNALFTAAWGLVQSVMYTFYYGFAGTNTWMDEAVKWLTPILNIGERTWVTWEYELGTVQLRGLGTVGVYAVAALALSVASFFLYRARRLESAGDVVSVRVMRPVFKYGVALCAGLGFGFMTCMFLGGVRPVRLVVASIFWGVVGCFAAQMLLDKSFRVFKKWKGPVAVAAVLALLFAGVALDFTGFETRVPAAGEVESVYVNGLNLVYLGDNGDYVSAATDDPDTIARLVELHRTATEQRDWASPEWGTGWDTCQLDLTYTLKNGGELRRRYTLWVNKDEADVSGSAAWALEQVYGDRMLYWQDYGFADLEWCLASGGRLESAEYFYSETRGYNEDWAWEYDGVPTAEEVELYFYGPDAQALLAAVMEDFEAGRIGVRHVDMDNGPAERSLTFRAVNSLDMQARVNIRVQDTAVSTLAVLERLAAQEIE